MTFSLCDNYDIIAVRLHGARMVGYKSRIARGRGPGMSSVPAQAVGQFPGPKEEGLGALE